MSGGTTDYTKLRLKRDRPDLYERVIAGDMTANAAAIEAGFRRPPKPRPTTPLEILDYAGEVLKDEYLNPARNRGMARVWRGG